MISFKHCGVLLLLALLSQTNPVHAAPAPFDIDLKELDRQKPKAPAKPEKAPAEKARAEKPKKPPVAAGSTGKARQKSGETSDYVRYTVRPGDHIFKILMARFGMSNEVAERMIPEIIRLNDISDIKTLTVGKIMLIPSKGQRERVGRSAKKGKSPKREEASEAAAVPESASKLEARGAADSDKAEAPPARAARSRRMEKKPPAAPAPLAPPVAPAPPAAPPPAPLAVPSVAAAPPAIPAAPAIPADPTLICSVTEKDPARIVDAALNALSIPWSRNRIIQSANGAPTTFSIRVDRYFEYRGGRYIVSINDSDPYSYTMIRLLEAAGYRVLRVGGAEDFKTVSGNLLTLIGLVPDFGKHVLQGGKEATGFLVRQEDAGGRRVLITAEPADRRGKWVMSPGCAAR